MRKKYWIVFFIGAAVILLLAAILPTAIWRLQLKQITGTAEVKGYDPSRTGTSLTSQMVSDFIWGGPANRDYETALPDQLASKETEVKEILQQFVDAAKEENREYLNGIFQNIKLEYYVEHTEIYQQEEHMVSLDIISCELADLEGESPVYSLVYESKTQTILSFSATQLFEAYPLKDDIFCDAAERYYRMKGIPAERYEISVSEDLISVFLITNGATGEFDSLTD